MSGPGSLGADATTTRLPQFNVLKGGWQLLGPELAELQFVMGSLLSVTWKRVLWLTLLVSALLPVKFLNWMFCLPFELVTGGIFQITNIVPSVIK